MDLKTDTPDRVEGIHIWNALIADTATAVTELVRVVIPVFDPELLWGPCKWMPRVFPEFVDVSEPTAGEPEPTHLVTIPTILMPTKGDFALVALDNYREPWIVVWWPAIYG